MLVLSQYIGTGYAARLLSASPAGVGYLLKDRVADVDEFTGAVPRVAAGGTASPPVRWFSHARDGVTGSPCASWTMDYLRLMAEAVADFERHMSVVARYNAIYEARFPRDDVQQRIMRGKDAARRKAIEDAQWARESAQMYGIAALAVALTHPVGRARPAEDRQ